MDSKIWDFWSKEIQNITAGYVPGGAKAGVLGTAIPLLNAIEKIGVSFIDKDILDIGCGNGRLPIALTLEGREIRSYTGLEIIPDCVQFCLTAFYPWSDYSFKLLDVNNARYWRKNKYGEQDAFFPVNASSFDLVICCSLFTHIPEHLSVIRYLDQIDLVCRPGAQIFSTWIFEGEDKSAYRSVQSNDWVFEQLCDRWDLVSRSDSPVSEFGHQDYFLSKKVSDRPHIG